MIIRINQNDIYVNDNGCLIDCPCKIKNLEILRIIHCIISISYLKEIKREIDLLTKLMQRIALICAFKVFNECI